MNFWKRNPLSKIVLPFILGLFITTELGFSVAPNFGYIPFGLFIIIVFVRFFIKATQRRNYFTFFLFTTLFFSFGIWRGSYHFQSIHNGWMSSEEIEMQITS